MTTEPVSLAIDPETLTSEAAAPKRGLAKRALLVGVSLAVLGAAGYAGFDYWTVGRFQVSTDDAYVQADNTTVAPKISGYLDQVLVGDNETVKAGQVLAHIDDRDFRTAVDQAKANIEVAEAAIANKAAALDTQQSIIDAAKATIAVDQANQTFAEQDNVRYATLAASGAGSVQNAQAATSRNAAIRATIAHDTAALATAVGQVNTLKAELAQAKATLTLDQAIERQAELNLGYTAIVAAVDGVVGNRTLRVGQYVQAGTQLMAIVPVQSAYIVANFKETQLTHVQAGQPVDVEIDTFPGVVAHGHVDSLAPGSGQEFALLPPDNATGNFTKIVQRIPVKIVLDAASPLAGELRPGMSVEPTITTKPKAEIRTAAALPGQRG